MFVLRTIILTQFIAALAALSAEPLVFYQKTAQESSPRLRAAEASAAAAKSNYLKESVFKENPDLMLGVMNVPLGTFPALNRDQMSGFVVGVSQKIALPWEDHYRKASSRQRAESEERDRDLITASLGWEIAEKYNTLHYSYHRLDSLREARSIMRSNLNILARSVKLQKNIVPQILEAKANLALIENEALQLESEIERLWLDFEILCGQKLTHAFTEGERKSWLNDFTNLEVPASFALAENLQYRKMRAVADAELAMLSLSRSSLFPEVTVSAAYLMRQPVTTNGMQSAGDSMLTLYASTPLPVFYPLKNKHEIDAQAEKVKYAEQILRDTAITLESAWKSEVIKAESLRRSVENYTKSILPAHSSAHKAHLATSAAQGMGVSEALAAYQMLLTSTQQRLSLVRDFYSAYNRLQFLSSKGGRS